MLTLEHVLAQDRLAQDVKAVELLYRQLLEQSPANVEAQAAYVEFLLTRGRNPEALSLFEKIRSEINKDTLLELVKSLIYRTEINRGIEILNNDFKENHTQPVEFLKGYAEGLRLARDEYAVFPIYVNPLVAWHTPQLQHSIVDPDMIMPGRFDGNTGEDGDQEPNRLVFLLGKWDKEQNCAKYLQVGISEEKYKEYGGTLKTHCSGFFVEILKKGEQVSLQCYPRRRLTAEEEGWIRPQMNMNRYLKAFMASDGKDDAS